MDTESEASSKVDDDENKDENVALLMGMAERIQSMAPEKKKGGPMLQQPQESYKEKLQRFKEERNGRLSGLRSQHRHIMDMVSMYLGIDQDTIQTWIIDRQEYCDHLESFAQEKGGKGLVFSYQDCPPPDLETGRFDPTLPPDTVLKGFVISNCLQGDVRGRSVGVWRMRNTHALENKALMEEVFYSIMDCDASPTASAQGALYGLLANVYYPAVSGLSEWGELKKTALGLARKHTFLGDLNSFVTFMGSTKLDLESLVLFPIDKALYNKHLSTIDAVMETSKNRPVVQEIEKTVRIWIKLMQTTLTESQQLRRENDTVGPLLELEYWRRQLAKFNSIVEHLKSTECRMHIHCLMLCKSKILKKWKRVDNETTDASNEAKDNVKYLYSLQKFCEPLYRTGPTTMAEHLPSLLYSIRMVFTTSRFFNTTERVSALLVKMTNQMVNTCRSYLTDNGKLTIWEQAKHNVLKKSEVCLNLYTRYYQSFQRIKREMAAAEEPPFDCSEMYVFGKFETFKKRLEEIVDVLETTLMYSILQSSTIDGIDEFADRFKVLFKNISTQPYDPLNHRKGYFNKDYETFKQGVLDIEYALHDFVIKMLDQQPNVNSLIQMAQRFEKLDLECLDIEERFLDILMKLQEEIENTRDSYNEQRQNPALARNVPPVSGRIMWVRQLYKRMEMPMDIVKSHEWVIKHKRSQKCIQLYNSLACVFLHYEQLHHEAWVAHVGQVRLGLSLPLLVKHTKTKMNVVNFDSYIFETISEAEHMWRLGLEVPDIARLLVFNKQKIIESYETVASLVSRNNSVRKAIPRLFILLMRALLLKLDRVFQPGFSSITWTSLAIPKFCEDIDKTLVIVDEFTKKVNDLKEARINEVFDGISKVKLIQLPEAPLDSKELLRINKEFVDKMGNELETKSASVEQATIELINKFMDTIEQPEVQSIKYKWLDPEEAAKPVGSQMRINAPEEAAFKEVDPTSLNDLTAIHHDCLEMFSFFNSKLIEALLRCTKVSLETLKKRSTGFTNVGGGFMDKPLFTTYLELHIPNSTINPSINDIQTDYAELVSNILNVHKYITVWGQRPSLSTIDKVKKTLNYENDDGDEGMETYYKTVAEQKDIVRIIISLQGAIIILLKPDISKLCETYLEWNYLWAENREQQIIDFIATKPLIEEVKDEFLLYDQRAADINNLPEFHDIGTIRVFTERFKMALLVESNAWKYCLGKHLSNTYKDKLVEMVDFITQRMKVLVRKIKDLDDVRLAMACLEEVRQNFIQMDMDLIAMEAAYALFSKFNVDIPQDDIDRVNTLRYNFTNMLEAAKEVQETVVKVQGPFQKELIQGVAKYGAEVEKFDTDFEEKGPMIEGLSAKEASDRVLLFQARFDDLWSRFEVYSSGERLFGMEVKDYPILHKRKKEFNLLNKLYGLYLEVNHKIDGYFELLWADVDTDVIITELTDFQNRCRKLPKAMKDWPAFIDLKQKIDDFNETCPLLEMMANKAMKDRHWKRISSLTATHLDIEDETFSLKQVMEAPLLNFKDDVEDICISAVKEKDIEAKLKQVIADWSVVDLQFGVFKTRGELLLKGGEVADVISILEDSLMVLNSLLSNRYNAPFKKDIQLWLNKLVTTSEVLEKWLVVQNLFMYLEAVFVGGDISKQMPAEAKRFSGIDKTWVKIMARAHELLNVVECCAGDETMSQLLPHLLEQLETCQKSLTGYLEQKRLQFPRFFFISDPGLLEILGQASDVHSIQAHLPSLFDAIDKVIFDEKYPDRIVGMKAAAGEIVPLDRSVSCHGGVEHWLTLLLASMRDTVRNVCAQIAICLNDPEFDIIVSYHKFPAQAGLIGIQILWTVETEQALALCKFDRTIMRTTNQRFLDLLNSLIDITTRELSKMERVQIETMITIHVHQRDIFDDMCKLKIRNPIDFEWQKQARFYYEEDTDDIWVKITDVDFLYQCEYLGVTDRLAITPLTDRCYITLSQAMGMNMGGAPAGPAGTGKTETTKDMGRALGKLVVVFNCSDQMDFRGLARIYKGLAQSGSWGCFDEFNRIELPVLSVAAQQINIVLTARKEKKATFVFNDGDIVSLNPEFGIFLTMNPGYAGRQELPENLKIMFRTVSMMVPDRGIIMRVKLASCGFKDNVPLSRKFFTLYKLCEEQLSKQVHYDFGLRNILSVLRTLGAQKRSNPGETEETIVMRVLREMNVSKLVDEDEPLFLSLIDDMFPGLKLTLSVNRELQRTISNQTSQMGLTNHAEWNLKVVQLYDTSLVRHGLMVLGPTGAGKTKCIHTLMRCITEMGKPHKEMRMNPKAITAPQMFGRLDVATNDWTDGIFSTLWRKTLKIKKTEYVWLVLDGPVDAVWIENLNSVLDDNKTLTLANGDRIVMAENSKLMFEPDNVDNASPATISRMGMVFMSASVLKWTPILDGWLKKRNSHEADVLKRLFDALYDDLHTYVQTRLKAKMAILEALYIRQCCDLLTGLLDSEEPRLLPDKHIEKIYLFSLMWSLGAVLELDCRTKMEDFVLKHPSRLGWPKLNENESIFEYTVSEDGKWAHWSEFIIDYIYPSDSVPEYTSILVPNVDNVRTAFLIQTVAKQKKAVLLIGEQGTAKTVMIKGFMGTFDSEVHLVKSFNFSSATTPNMFQRIIESYVDKRVGTSYGPPAGKEMTVFIDDINMPLVNEWGDQITNEIVRQLMEAGGFFSLDRPGDFSTILDVHLMGAMIHPGGGRNDIPPRLKRQFCVFNCTIPSNSSMDKIFTVIGQGYFCDTRFNENIVEFLPNLISLTRIVWQQTKAKMLPTPAKFHYVFNLRDLSRIWQGLLTIQGPECQDENMLLKLWKHEFTRVIADRFTDAKDRDWFAANMRKTSEEQLKEGFEMYPDVDTYFVDFLRDAPEPTGEETEDVSLEPPKIYEEIPSYQYVTDKVFFFMDQYNEQVRGALMDLVFFRDALVHLMIISRIVRMQRGNALLVGVGGSGKQSLTRLSSFIAGYRMFQIQLTRSYNQSNLQDDLKFLYRVAGLEGHGMTFIFTDNEVKDENFLEYINNVLSSGEIANLFAKDELDEIQSALIGVMKKVSPKTIPTNDNLYDFFISRARSNLHVVLCFSPVGEKFRSRSLKFPGLISGCTIDWFSRWPNDALVAVSTHILKSFEIVCSPQIKTAIIGIMADVQDSVVETCVSYYDKYRRQTYVTPKSYLSFLDGYTKIYVDKKAGIDEMAQKMIVGLDKLVEAQVSVDILRKELVLKEKDIIIATTKAEEVLEVVLVAAEAAQKVKGEAMATKERAEALVTVISADQKVAEAKLEAAKPALEAAEAALQTIKASDIATVRKLGKPPYLITLIMDAVLIYFKKKIDPVKPDPDKQFLMPAWAESLKVMADSKFLSNLQQYPKDTINAEMIDLLVPYFNFPQYTFEAAKSACGNVAGLIQWTLAMTSFYSVNKEVLPLKANLDIQRARYNKAAEELDAAMTLLRAKEEEVAACQKQYDEAMALKQAVQEDATKCKNKMDAASALINGLAGERVRWTEACAQFKSEIDRLVGDVLLLTGFLSYTGPFNQEYRTMMQKKWFNDLVRQKIPVSQNLNITDSLVDTATIGEWNLQGLPTDDLSIQNGIIVTKASRFPLLIDPQNQGISWIKEKEKVNDLIVTQLNHKYFRQHLEDCVSLGRPMLIEDILEELDPVLDNVLEKNYIKIGTSYKVKVGDKEVDVNNDFRLYITTKLANPSYTPEVSARTSIIDFTVTIKGLEDQLLGRVILTEKRELETERTNLIKDVTANKRKMSELEANLLYKLSTTQGSLVDDETVIEVLNVTKNTAAEVQEKLTIARDTEIKINAAREEFRPVATRGSVLYFLIVSLTAVNCMYQTSLVQFLERFDISMARSDKTPITHRRINFIIEYLTYDIFKYISRGLYETHKYLFVLMMCLKIDIDREHITYDEMQSFIKGGAALDLNSVAPKPAKWITDMTWLNLVQLSSLRHFQHILTQVTNGEKTWKAWFDKDAPEEATIPDGYQSLDVWKRLLMIRSWCPDRTLAQSRKYISNSLGARFGEAVILNLELMHSESRALTPLCCFLSMGNDPTPNIESLAKKMEIPCKSISMGQGQEIHARKLVTESLERGSWVLLQNCHLGLEYMLEIYSQFLELEKTKELHPEFRLWITTEPHPKFSISLLQMCVKFTNEPPSGIKAGLLRTYSTMGQDMLDYSDSIFYLPLIYAISFLHTIVQERRKFGPLGWNIPYEFNSADWLASCMFVQNHLDDLDPKRGISWQTIRYMLGEVQYGGRVTDDYDKRLLNTFAKCWFSEIMFNEDFVFYKGYRIMKYKNQNEYIGEIEEMLTTDPPQAYGLHSNADITYQSNTVSTMLNTILSIQPKESSGGGGETRETVVARQAQDMLDKLPPNYDPYEVRERLKIMGILAPMNIFLRQEIDRMQKVIKLVRTTLRDLLLAVEGTIIMNEALRDALDNIFDARIPNVWKKSSWASATLGFWFTELLERNAQFSTWVYTGRPLTFWMTGFFNPQGFLTYMRQEVTRAHKGWALDGVSLHNTVSKMIQEEVKVAPLEGVYVFGLYLDGAGWDRRNSRLAESPQKVLYTMLPVVHIYAINSVAPKSSQLYMCPVYKKPNRTDLTYVTPLWLESVKNPDHWILRGVALLCDIK